MHINFANNKAPNDSQRQIIQYTTNKFLSRLHLKHQTTFNEQIQLVTNEYLKYIYILLVFSQVVLSSNLKANCPIECPNAWLHANSPIYSQIMAIWKWINECEFESKIAYFCSNKTLLNCIDLKIITNQAEDIPHARQKPKFIWTNEQNEINAFRNTLKLGKCLVSV